MATESGEKERMPHPYDMHTITEEMRLKAKRELNEDERTREMCLEELRNLLKGEKNLHFQDEDAFLLQFLRARKFNVQRAFQLCKNYYHVRTGDLFGKIEFSTVMEMMSYGFCGLLPYRDKDGCPIAYFSIDIWDAHETPSRESVQAFMVILMNFAMSPATQICGVKAVVDASGQTYGNLFRAVRHMSLFFYSALNHFPMRYKAIHVINNGQIFAYTWKLIKHLASKKLRSRIHLHCKNIEELHKHIPPSLLPQDFGGTLGFFDKEVTMNELKKYEIQFEETKQYGYKIRH